jgi:tetratricopeptide (TPR) repeat protein
MLTRRLVVGCAALVALIGLVSWGRAAPLRSRPFVPSSAAEVLERLPERFGAPRSPNAVEAPADARLAEQQARREIARYQATSDPRFLGHAEAALAAFWDSPDAPTPILVLRAKLRASNHEFTSALADLDAALARAPAEPQARFERASIRTVLGQYAGAREDCAALGDGVAELFALGCSAAVRGVTGDARAAAAELARAVEASPDTGTETAWAASLVGELELRAGDVQSAERWLRRALDQAPGDAYTLGTLADLLLDAGRPRDVVTLLASFERIDGLLLRLAIAERALSMPAASAHVARLAERFREAELRGSAVHRREQARFELGLRDDAARALRLSLENFAIQREVWDARLVLEAALAADRPSAAAAALEHVRRSGLEDPVVARLVRAVTERRR